MRAGSVRAILLAICCSSCVVILACPQKWTLSVMDLDTPAYPALCLSARPGCDGPPPFLGFLSVERVDSLGNKIESVWQLEMTGSQALRRFRYGIVPNGFREVLSAKPLMLNENYCIRGRCLRIASPDGRPIAEVFSQSELSLGRAR